MIGWHLIITVSLVDLDGNSQDKTSNQSAETETMIHKDSKSSLINKSDERKPTLNDVKSYNIHEEENRNNNIINKTDLIKNLTKEADVRPNQTTADEKQNGDNKINTEAKEVKNIKKVSIKTLVYYLL